MFNSLRRHHGALEAGGAAMTRRRRPTRAPSAHPLLQAAVLSFRKGRFDQVQDFCRTVLRAERDNAMALVLFGQATVHKGDLGAAAAFYDHAVAICPKIAALHADRGVVLSKQGRFAEAVDAWRRAVALEPDNARAHRALGAVLESTDDVEGALAALRRAVSLAPGDGQGYGQLCKILLRVNDVEGAVAAGRRAVELAPLSADAHTHLGIALFRRGLLDEALERYRHAVRLDPASAEAHANEAIILLTRGDLEAGWDKYAWRWKTPQFAGMLKGFARPLWEGEPLDGRTVLLTPEQGLGDTLHFIRYAPLVAARGGRVVALVQPPLAGLVASVPGVAAVAEEGGPIPEHDVFAPLLQLPRIFRTRLETIPAAVPYLSVAGGVAGAVATPRRGAMRVGLVWAGNPRHHNDSRRSFPPDTYGPLAGLEGVELFSLQAGEGAATPRASALAGRITDLREKLTSFEVTAATIGQLDLVVTVDTAVAHLAGALGRPVWVLLPDVPDWRWLLERVDSPWYPSMRLFRQSSPGDWAGVIERVGAALERLHRSTDGG